MIDTRRYRAANAMIGFIHNAISFLLIGLSTNYSITENRTFHSPHRSEIEPNVYPISSHLVSNSSKIAALVADVL